MNGSASRSRLTAEKELLYVGSPSSAGPDPGPGPEYECASWMLGVSGGRSQQSAPGARTQLPRPSLSLSRSFSARGIEWNARSIRVISGLGDPAAPWDRG